MAAVEVSRSGGLCRVTLNRPEKLNALNDEVRVLLHQAFVGVIEDVGCRVVLLEGAGRCFSAGADLTPPLPEAVTGDSVSWVARRQAAGGWQRLLDLIESIPQVTVAKLHGHVVGGAALLAASCDIRVAADDVGVRIPEVAIGIPLTWAGVPRLVREIGLPMTRYLVMTGRPLNGAEALRCGFVQLLVPSVEIEAATEALIEDLLAMPAAPLAMTRALTAAIGKTLPASHGWADPDLAAWVVQEPEALESAAQYLDRRVQRKPRSP